MHTVKYNPMTTLEKLIEEFEQKLPCKDIDCDGKGSIPRLHYRTVQVSDTEAIQQEEWEQEQCQFCFEYRFPVRDLITKAYNAGREEERERVVGIIKNWRLSSWGNESDVLGELEEIITAITKKE